MPYPVSRTATTAYAPSREVVTRISLEHGAVVIGVVGVAVILLSWVLFRRRDVD